jgi:hypothetical protein
VWVGPEERDSGQLKALAALALRIAEGLRPGVQSVRSMKYGEFNSEGWNCTFEYTPDSFESPRSLTSLRGLSSEKGSQRRLEGDGNEGLPSADESQQRLGMEGDRSLIKTRFLVEISSPSVDSNGVASSKHKTNTPTHDHLVDGFGPGLDEYIMALENFLCRPYWRRMWIIQELALAQDVVIYCGKNSVTWKELRTIVDLCNEGGLLPALTTKPIDNLSKFQKGIASNNPISIFDALVDSTHALATDQRDKVYGVRGLSFMAKRFIPTPSYIGSVEEMCFRMTLHIFRNTKSLDIIPLLGNAGSRPGLPSWVPDELGRQKCTASDQLFEQDCDVRHTRKQVHERKSKPKIMPGGGHQYAEFQIYRRCAVDTCTHLRHHRFRYGHN